MARALAQSLGAGRAGFRGDRFLFLDEPTAGLDLEHQHGLLRSARSLAERTGAGVVAVLHDLNLAAEYADSILALKGGAPAAQGEPSRALSPAMVREVFAVEAWLFEHPGSGLPTILTSAARG
jgi:iron complex transport system ATP-binding protein